MTTRARFSTDAADAPLACNLGDGIVGASTAQLIVQVSGLLATDTLSKLIFTAKVNASDADNAASTIQKTLNAGDAGLTAAALNPGLYLAVFDLTSADTTALLSASRVYDVKA